VSDHTPIFDVIVDAKGLKLRKIKPGDKGYRRAGKRAILRQRDAIEAFRKLKEAGKGYQGSFAFHFLETARTFSMLLLQAKARDIQDSLDAVLAYDGSSKKGGR
jgi:hypothetical protein